jgi:hypothetical protein
MTILIATVLQMKTARRRTLCAEVPPAKAAHDLNSYLDADLKASSTL